MPAPDIVCNTAVMSPHSTDMAWHENILLSTDLNYHLISNTARDERGNLVILLYPLIFSLTPDIVLLEVVSVWF